MNPNAPKLSELPIGATIEMATFDYTYRGREKRNMGYGKVECFVFYSEELKSEKLLELHKTQNREIRKNGKKYKF